MTRTREIRPKIWYEYGDWLLDQIRFDKKRYYKLTKHLHDIPFEWSKEVDFDENRAMDGTYNRYYFFRELGINAGDFDYPCSILEMFVAFSLKIAREWLGYDENYMSDRPDLVFFMFLRNLGLDFLDDSEFSEAKCDEIIGYFVLREYKNDGIGSLFPLKRAVKDYNKMEIWKQMNIFLTQFDIKTVNDIEKFL